MKKRLLYQIVENYFIEIGIKVGHFNKNQKIVLGTWKETRETVRKQNKWEFIYENQGKFYSNVQDPSEQKITPKRLVDEAVIHFHAIKREISFFWALCPLDGR